LIPLLEGSVMGKHRLIPHLIVEGGLDAIDFYERALPCMWTADGRC
jgi:hypothetical protein